MTGGAGFIGSHMVELLLAEDYEVRAIDSLATGSLENVAAFRSDPRFTLETRDVRHVIADDPLFDGVDYVFHFAGIGDIVPSIERPTEYMDTNVMGTVRVLEAARHAGVRKFVYAASSSCYGPDPPVPTPEDAPADPRYPYALSKYLGEQAVLHWGRVYELPVVSIRIFNAYGPRSRTSGAYGAVFGVFLAQKLAGKPFTVVGDGTQTRDFVFATDVARAFLLAATSPPWRKPQLPPGPAERASVPRGHQGTIYNLGSGKPQSVNRLVELLEGPVVHIPWRPGEPRCTWADITRIRSELGWEPRVSFEQGVGEMLKNIDYWRNAPVWEPATIEQATKSWFKFLGDKKA